jgi:predicted metal-dependent enzyme (double-stranded beta helix superfamily)
MGNTTIVSELIELLDKAVERASTEGCCFAIKDALEHVVRSGKDFIDEPMLRPVEGRYARRLLHRDPSGRYSVLVMVWNSGQGTPLHDHAHMWCVECVYRGRIKVVSYDLQGQEGDRYRFSREKEVFAGPGEAGALIPPFEYHTLENAQETPSATIHVYGGDMTWCDAFFPESDGLYRLERRELSFTA